MLKTDFEQKPRKTLHSTAFSDRSVPMDMYQEFREPLSQCLPEVFFGLQEVKIGDGTKLEALGSQTMNNQVGLLTPNFLKVTAIIRVMAKFSFAPYRDVNSELSSLQHSRMT